ncbi:twin-arginine translocase TatA/TatE family subunit [Desulfosporosinus sp. Sb-LF]|uniref:Sec-independent protein translocase subunit TatA/TatB n=1 Tax=Desulfosporosinus sp. Sb-LF TaxID=2560027 RepID=UPI00107EEC5A|nr:twin-arginine translocase TatA/TatE family subunit [Desulfosporosinus sp. Sb-LF]TGE34441.1 twin-arginine translocase TatA/TatE family subunit [Desulfosporosinus sp. Sb-LF]
MGFTEILMILALALILFGPEDLPDIARTIGKVVFEIRKATHELTKEFQSSINLPTDVLNKAFEQTTSSRVAKPHSPQTVAINSKADEELLTYEDEIPDDPLAELPSDMVSYEEKGASR